jgi:hypothetical protein
LSLALLQRVQQRGGVIAADHGATHGEQAGDHGVRKIRHVQARVAPRTGGD